MDDRYNVRQIEAYLSDWRYMTQIGLQTFTVRKHMKNEDQIIATLHKLNKMGVKCVEVARMKFTMDEGEIIAQTCHKLGIKIGSTQIKYKRIIKDFDNVVALHQLWACDYIGVSVLPRKYMLQGEKGIHNFATRLNTLGERLYKKGLKLLYHHHNFEYARYGDKTGLEILMEETNPLYVNLMMDTYWTQRGGRNPVDQIHQFSNRIKVIHMRDFKVTLNYLARDYVISDATIGDGNLDIKGIIEAAESHNIPFLPIEQETKTPFEDIARSVEYLKDCGFGRLLQ